LAFSLRAVLFVYGSALYNPHTPKDSIQKIVKLGYVSCAFVHRKSKLVLSSYTSRVDVSFVMASNYHCGHKLIVFSKR